MHIPDADKRWYLQNMFEHHVEKLLRIYNIIGHPHSDTAYKILCPSLLPHVLIYSLPLKISYGDKVTKENDNYLTRMCTPQYLNTFPHACLLVSVGKTLLLQQLL